MLCRYYPGARTPPPPVEVTRKKRRNVLVVRCTIMPSGFSTNSPALVLTMRVDVANGHPSSCNAAPSIAPAAHFRDDHDSGGTSRAHRSAGCRLRGMPCGNQHVPIPGTEHLPGGVSGPPILSHSG